VKVKVKGLDELEAEGRPAPPHWLPFVSFHNMVILGTFFIFAMAFAVWKLRSGRLFTMRKFLWLLLISIPLPLAACQLGWIVAEVGRQPWIVYGVMKTSDAFSTNLTPAHVLFSLILFGLIYLAMGCIYVYMFFHKLKHFDVNHSTTAPVPQLSTGN
jgi:cytochrome d ubiquinol oxidase subunit I